MITSILVDIDENTFFDTVNFEYDIFHNHINIGRYDISVSKEIISLSYFEIYSQYRGIGFANSAIELILDSLKELSLKYNVVSLEVCASPLDNSISMNKLIEFYSKYLNVEVDYENKTSVILRGNL